MIDAVRRAFMRQRVMARRRGISFQLTYEEWLKIWQDSGHLHERGCGRGRYCMSRYGDKGPYALENVKIIPFVQNCSEIGINDPDWARRNAAGKRRKPLAQAS